ncbi:unnamed protein product [Calicophoron daubneyi]|uniref:DUF302 domain-containing protein n=1 Tax=Calicophoron daubneyi TaxID=300641 RepID=A0AAV2TGK4_CALDB
MMNLLDENGRRMHDGEVIITYTNCTPAYVQYCLLREELTRKVPKIVIFGVPTEVEGEFIVELNGHILFSTLRNDSPEAWNNIAENVKILKDLESEITKARFNGDKPS